MQGYTYEGAPVYAKDLKVNGAMTLLLKDAIKPNLVQTLEKTLLLCTGDPFANIAHGCNSVVATKLGLKLADYCITEAGFGAVLGAEKFFNIKCRYAGLKPDATVLVATIRAIKYNGGVDKNNLNTPNIEALKKGFAKMLKNTWKTYLNLVFLLWLPLILPILIQMKKSSMLKKDAEIWVWNVKFQKSLLKAVTVEGLWLKKLLKLQILQNQTLNLYTM